MPHLHSAKHTLFTSVYKLLLFTCVYIYSYTRKKCKSVAWSNETYCFSVTFANDEQWSLSLFEHCDSSGELVTAGQTHWRRRTTRWKPVVKRSQELNSDKTCLNDLSVTLSNCFIHAPCTHIHTLIYTLGQANIANFTTGMFWEMGGNQRTWRKPKHVTLHTDSNLSLGSNRRSFNFLCSHSKHF